MLLLAWLGCASVALVSLGLAAVTRHDHRRDAGLLVMAAAVGGLLLTLGADVLAALWLLLVLPRCWGAPTAPGQADTTRTAVGPQVAAGVLAGVLWGALVYLGQRADWFALPAGGFEAQSAMLGGRLLTDDLVLGLGLLLAALALLGGVRGPRMASWTSTVGHDGRREGPS
jgi:hypothetical protein